MPRNREAGRSRGAAVASAGGPHELAAARHRALLRMRVEICTALRMQQGSASIGAALAAALRLGDEAAAELALLPDTPERRRDDAVLGAGALRAEFEVQMNSVVAAYRDGRPLDLFTASPAELLACCIARAGLDLASVRPYASPQFAQIAATGPFTPENRMERGRRRTHCCQPAAPTDFQFH